MPYLEEEDPLLQYFSAATRRQYSAPAAQTQEVDAPRQPSSWTDYLSEGTRSQYQPEQLEAARYYEQLPQAAPPEDPDTYILRRAIPFASAIRSFNESSRVGQARDAVASGRGTQGDRDILSAHEASQLRDEQRTLPESILSGIAHVPALAGEALIGGAVIGRVAPALAQAPRLLSGGALASRGAFGMASANVAAQTALMPSMWLSQAAERAARNGGEWYYPQNIGPAALMGLSQVAVLGSLGGIANNMPGTSVAAFLKRMGTRTVVGMGEQQAIDAIAGIVDQVLPEVFQFGTHGGIIGLALQGKWGEAAKHAATQAAVFATFSALHPVLHGEQANAPKPEAPPEVAPEPIPVQPEAPAPGPIQPMPRPMTEPTQMPGFMRPRPEPAPPRPGEMPYRTPEPPLPPAKSPIDMTGYYNPAKPAEMSKPMLDAAERALTKRQGKTPDKVGLEMLDIYQKIQKEIQRNDGLTSEEGRFLIEGMKLKGEMKRFAESTLEALNLPIGTAKPAEAKIPVEVRPEAATSQPERVERPMMPPGKPIEVPTGATKPAEPGAALRRAEVKPESVLPIKMQEAIVNANLKPAEQAALESVFRSSLREAAVELGVSHETVRSRSEKAFQKLRALDMETFGEAKNLAEFMDSIKATERDILAHQKGGERVAEGTDVLEEMIAKESEEFRKMQEPEQAEYLSQVAKEMEQTYEEHQSVGRQLGLSREKIQAIDDAASAAEVAAYRAKRTGRPAPAGQAEGVPGTAPGEAVPRANITNRPTPRSGSLNLEPIRDVARFGKETIEKVMKLVRDHFAADVSEMRIVNRGLGRKGEAKLPEGWTKEEASKFIKDRANQMMNGYEYVVDNLRQFAGKKFVQLSKLSPEAAFKGILWTARERLMTEYLPEIIKDLAGPKPSAENSIRNDQAIAEMSRQRTKAENLRLEKEALAAGKKDEAFAYKAAADEVHSLIGDDTFLFKTEAEWKAHIASDEFQRYYKTRSDEVHPYLKKWGKMAGLTEEDSINQLPDNIFNFLRKTPEQLAEAGIDTTKPYQYKMKPGDLGNVRQYKLDLAKAAERTLPAEFYDWDPVRNLHNSFERTSKSGLEKNYTDALVKDGVAEWGIGGKKNPTIGGKPSVELPGVKYMDQSLYVDARAAPEVKQSFMLNDPSHIPLISEVGKLATKGMMLFPMTEMTSHVKNLGTTSVAAGVMPWDPFVQAWKMFNADPVQKKAWIKLAELGATRSKGLEAGQFLPERFKHLDPTTYFGKVIDIADKLSRLVSNAGHERNVRWGRVADTEANRAEAVSMGSGNYDKSTQHKFIVYLRDTGVSPFATAASNFYMQGMRMLGMGPMVKATSPMHALSMRAEVLAKSLTVLGLAFAINKNLWGNIFGDDDTPFGAFKTGKTADGKTTYFDLTGLTGATRGARALGVLALTEGYRQGSSPARIGDRAFEAMSSSLLHIGEGPIVSAGHTLLTGRNLIGQSVEATPPPSGSHLVERGRATLVQANPISAAFLGESRNQQDMTYGQKALSLLGPYNPFKQRGDQVLAEMHGRLREIEDARKVFLQNPANISGGFPQEAEYSVLHRLNATINRLEDVMKGRARTTSGTRQLPVTPQPQEVARLRMDITNLARLAMQAQATVRQPTSNR